MFSTDGQFNAQAMQCEHYGIEIMLPHPLIVPADLFAEWSETAIEIAELLAKPFKDKIPSSNSNIPHYLNAHPHCMAVDFAVCNNNNKDIRLIEAQAFPSLYFAALAFENGLDLTPKHRLNWKERKSAALELFTSAHDEHAAIMLDITPFQQTSGYDFVITARERGILPCSLQDICYKKGVCYAYIGGSPKRVTKIYNRIIPSDVPENLTSLFRQLLQDMSIQWISHPFWFNKISKASLSDISHPKIPLSIDADISNPHFADHQWVLKPKFNYGGNGVNLSPTEDDIKKVSGETHVLQEKVEYINCTVSPLSGTPLKAELRFMLIYHNGQWKFSSCIARLKESGAMNMSKEMLRPGEGATIVIPSHI
jgi:hypothetical protein